MTFEDIKEGEIYIFVNLNSQQIYTIEPKLVIKYDIDYLKKQMIYIIGKDETKLIFEHLVSKHLDEQNEFVYRLSNNIYLAKDKEAAKYVIKKYHKAILSNVSKNIKPNNDEYIIKYKDRISYSYKEMITTLKQI